VKGDQREMEKGGGPSGTIRNLPVRAASFRRPSRSREQQEQRAGGPVGLVTHGAGASLE